jgi:hypothetical protein
VLVLNLAAINAQRSAVQCDSLAAGQSGAELGHLAIDFEATLSYPLLYCAT